MYRMIVVDDEAAITDLLYQAVSEEFVGSLEVYRAYSGEECLELMEKGSFDIVMTDISMPAFSGLDLLAALTRYYPKTRKLILSAYDNFGYAKEAIELGVASYVLKSDGDEILFAAIRKALEELQEEQELFSASEKEKLRLQQSGDAERHRILRHFLRGMQITGSLNEQVCPRWIDFTLPMDFALVTLQVEEALQRRFQIMALEDSFAEYLKPYYRYEMVEMGISDVALLVQETEEVKKGNQTHVKPSLYAAYENAQNSFYGVTQQYVNIIYTKEKITAMALPEKYDTLKELMQGCGDFACSIILSEESAWRSIRAQRTDIKKEIARVIKYIEEHTEQDLSLLMLADVAYLNPSYLSHLFKLETGMTISEYIKEVRMARCKRMLADPRYHIHEVARAVGFDNASYFTRFFKRTTGITPQSYRQQLTEQ